MFLDRIQKILCNLSSVSALRAKYPRRPRRVALFSTNQNTHGGLLSTHASSSESFRREISFSVRDKTGTVPNLLQSNIVSRKKHKVHKSLYVLCDLCGNESPYSVAVSIESYSRNSTVDALPDGAVRKPNPRSASVSPCLRALRVNRPEVDGIRCRVSCPQA